MAEAAVQDGDLRQQLLAIVVEEGMIKDRTPTADTRLDELGIESADFVMILMAVEEKFGVYVPVDEKLTEAETVGALLDVVVGHIEEHRQKVTS